MQRAIDHPIHRKRIIWSRRMAAEALTIVLILMVATLCLQPFAASAQRGSSFDNLSADQPIIDETGESLSPDQIALLQTQLDALERTGADVVLYVRELDATPQETLDQVEALQQDWVANTGANQETTIAILINRNPTNSRDARAGIFVGRTYNDGNIPEDQQVEIVNDVLIPPLRDGDVYASFSNTLTRLEQNILHGPPRNAFEHWSADNGGGWIPLVTGALAAVGAAGSAMLFRRRKTVQQSPLPPTTVRPELLSPAIAGALVAGSPQVSAFPATLLDLAARGALRLEPESEGGTFSKPKIQIRLIDGILANSAEEADVWAALEKRSDSGLVSSRNLLKAATDTKALKATIKQTMQSRGWLDMESSGPKNKLALIAAGAIVLSIVTFVIGAIGEQWVAFVGAGLLMAVGVLAIVLYSGFSGLSVEGQTAALPWKAYRDGLKQAAKQDSLPLNLDDVLADAVAFNLGSNLNKRMKAATEQGVAFRAFTASTSGYQSSGNVPVFFPWWVAYNSSVTTVSGSGSSSTVSGGGAGGGGGAAGST